MVYSVHCHWTVAFGTIKFCLFKMAAAAEPLKYVSWEASNNSLLAHEDSKLSHSFTFDTRWKDIKNFDLLFLQPKTVVLQHHLIMVPYMYQHFPKDPRQRQE